jgi:N-methylhydantoinase A
MILKRVCDCRYEGQGYELRVDAPAGEITEEWIEEVKTTFHAVHEREYASKFVDQDVQAINIRVIGVGAVASENSFAPQPEALSINDKNILKAPVYFWINDSLEEIETSFYQRSNIPFGTELVGPAIIQQKDSTTVIPPLCKALFDNHGNIVIDMKEKISNKAEKLVETVNR